MVHKIEYGEDFDPVNFDYVMVCLLMLVIAFFIFPSYLLLRIIGKAGD